MPMARTTRDTPHTGGVKGRGYSKRKFIDDKDAEQQYVTVYINVLQEVLVQTRHNGCIIDRVSIISLYTLA